MRDIVSLRDDFINLRILPTNWLGDSPSRFDEYAKYSSMVNSVVEFGVYTGLSTAAFIQGGAQKIRSYDITDKYLTVLPELRKAASTLGIDFEFIIGNSLSVEIEDTDLLFIDTVHEKDYCLNELNRHHSRVRKFIMLHDVTSFPGVLLAAKDFLFDHPEWKIFDWDMRGCGLLVLHRV